MHPQPQALDDAQPRTIQQFDNNLMNSDHRTNDPFRLIPSQDNRNLDPLGRPFCVDFLVQWLLEYMFGNFSINLGGVMVSLFLPLPHEISISFLTDTSIR